MFSFFSANYFRELIAENIVISPVQLQQPKDMMRRNVAVEFPQKFARVSVSTVDIGGGKVGVCGIAEARQLTQNMLGVLLKCLVMPDEVVLDMTRLTEIVLRHPVNIKMFTSQTRLLENETNELFEFHVVSDHRSM